MGNSRSHHSAGDCRSTFLVLNPTLTMRIFKRSCDSKNMLLERYDEVTGSHYLIEAYTQNFTKTLYFIMKMV